jgi:hypothetical protein
MYKILVAINISLYVTKIFSSQNSAYEKRSYVEEFVAAFIFLPPVEGTSNFYVQVRNQKQ